MSTPTYEDEHERASMAPDDRDLRRLSTWNDTRAAYPSDVCLHGLVEEQVERTPARTAVSFEGVEISYHELDARANRIAYRLRELGVRPDQPVGVCLQRSPELVCALLAVLKAGGAYLPLDPAYPAQRLRFMAEDTDVGTILTHGPTTGSVPDAGAEVLRVEDVWREGSDPGPISGGAEPEDLAYVMYTSGSTGRPKGVMVEHRSIVNRLFWMQDQYDLGPEDVAIQKTPFSFDVSVWEFFWPLMVGARLEVVRPDGHKDGGHLARVVDGAGVTVMHFVPSMLDLFLEVDDVGTLCRSLDHVICSGEALPRDLVERFHRSMPPEVVLWNLYGPTEAAVDVTWWRCRRESDDRTVPIGRPVANTRIHVVDENLERVPVGEVGELVIGGVQVARGYWNRPDLTAEAFIPDPVDPEREGPDGRAYRTGDLARWREDGVVEFLGRVDHQVKIRGQRVELGEIEAVLREQPDVLQAAALVREDSPGDARLVAYVVLEQGREPDTDAIRKGLARDLPEVMIPARIVALDEMPLSPNGKLDRGELPEPGGERPDLGVAYAAPRNDLETFLADGWADILGLDRVGIHDPVFELGASSLHAARFVNRIQETLDAFVYVVTVFDAPTVAEYADFLVQDYPEAVEEAFGDLDAGKTRAPAPGGGGEAAPAGRESGDGRPGTTERSRSGGHRIDEAAIRTMKEAVPTVPLRDPPPESPPGDPVVFILAPPRSGTTLLRVMLAGHPELFAAAELQLLHFERLGQRREAFTGKYEVWLDGVIRALMEIDDLDPEGAKARMAEWEAADLDVRSFYRLLQERIGDRMLVEKTPSYALDPQALQRTSRDFREPFFIHLSRHPFAMVESFVSYHMEQILYLHDHPFDARQLGELVWTLSHRRVQTFLGEIPGDRHHHMRFEDLVREPEAAMRELCPRLGVPYDPVLTRPYDDLDGKMVDGVHDDSTPMGDTKLLEREGIDPSVAEKWKGVLENDYLGDPTWETAASLGYERPSGSARTDPPGDGSGEGDRELGSRGAVRRRRLRRRRAGRGAGEDDTEV